MDREDIADILFFGIIVILLLLMSGAMVYQMLGTDVVDETTNYDIWDAECPFGHYWTDIEGGGGFLYVHLDSSPSEAYTIKYMVGDELKTIILDSQSNYTHIIFVNKTSEKNMTFSVVQYKNSNTGTPGHKEYYIYLIDPKAMVGGTY